jgi:hypothetical protein
VLAGASILRIYDPVECDERGVPLDWDRCRTCGDKGYTVDMRVPRVGPRTALPEGCDTCGGYGSLKAAALAERVKLQADAEFSRRIEPFKSESLPADQGAALEQIERHAFRIEEVAALAREHVVVRCEACGHPMSEGTWEATPAGDWTDDDRRFAPDESLPLAGILRHFSSCDQGCRHGGPIRCDSASELTTQWDTLLPDVDGDVVRAIVAGGSVKVESSWRSVDVRTLGWPHDLRPYKLAVLCLRCYAASKGDDSHTR